MSFPWCSHCLLFFTHCVQPPVWKRRRDHQGKDAGVSREANHKRPHHPAERSWKPDIFSGLAFGELCYENMSMASNFQELCSPLLGSLDGEVFSFMVVPRLRPPGACFTSFLCGFPSILSSLENQMEGSHREGKREKPNAARRGKLLCLHLSTPSVKKEDWGVERWRQRFPPEVSRPQAHHSVLPSSLSLRRLRCYTPRYVTAKTMKDRKKYRRMGSSTTNPSKRS